MQLARTRADLIITTGGLGPTCDDLTKEVVAGAFGIPLELNEAEEARLRGLYRERHTYMTENHLQQVMLPDLMNEMRNPTLAPYAKEGECLVRITAKAPTEAEAEAMIAPCLARVQRELGAFAYGVDTPNIETCAAELLLRRQKTIAVADSCTGGMLGDMLTNVPGASAIFAGGIIAYNNDTKTRLLDVDPALIARCGAVSPEVAGAMAEHARTIFGTDLAMSITGLAGPEGDGVHTVGTLFVALATPDGTFFRTLHKDKWGRVRIKHAAANHAFDMVRRYLTGLPVEIEENR